MDCGLSIGRLPCELQKRDTEVSWGLNFCMATSDLDAEADCDHMDRWDGLRLRQLDNSWLHVPLKEVGGTLPCHIAEMPHNTHEG